MRTRPRRSQSAQGNEPNIVTAPDGTIYLSALQHIYRSTDGGASFTELPGPIYASQLNLNSDSSIAVDPGNRLYWPLPTPPRFKRQASHRKTIANQQF